MTISIHISSRVNVQPEDRKSPMSILKTFLTNECIQNVVDSTNKYAEILLENSAIQARMNNSQCSIFSSWKPTNFDEMWLYIKPQ